MEMVIGVLSYIGLVVTLAFVLALFLGALDDLHDKRDKK